MSRITRPVSLAALAALALPTVKANAQDAPGEIQAISLLGDTLRAPALAADTRAELVARLGEAEALLAAQPSNPDALIWVGRRRAYLGDYRGAMAAFTRGIDMFPTDARFLRHRGHRYITVREADSAIADLERATVLIAGRPDEVEPDGLPNERNVPTSTLHTNLWYHLGLAYYLRGRFDDALRAYRECMSASRNPDMLVATSHWLYMTLRRLGRESEADALLTAITPDLDVIENRAYHRLLLMYKGVIAPDSLPPDESMTALDDATTAYGIGNWHLYNGRTEPAMAVFRRILAGGNWAAFGYIAAEAELARATRQAQDSGGPDWGSSRNPGKYREQQSRQLPATSYLLPAQQLPRGD